MKLSGKLALAALTNADRLGVLGDVHGSYSALKTAVTTFEKHGANVFIQIGDFGLIWPRDPKLGRRLDQLESFLSEKDFFILWIDGNHEDFDRLERYEIDEETGLRPLREHIVHIPRGFRITNDFNKTLAFLGGAASIDLEYRTIGKSWWPQEQINDIDLEKLGDNRADILFAHDAPLGHEPLNNFLKTNGFKLSPKIENYARTVRSRLDEGFQAVRPEVVFSGHYHVFTAGLIEHASGEAKAIVLDQADVEPQRYCAALLDFATGDILIDVFDLTGENPHNVVISRESLS